LADSLPEYLATCLKEKPVRFHLKLAKQLDKRLDTCFGKENYRIEKSWNQHARQWLWAILRVLRVLPKASANTNQNLSSLKNTSKDGAKRSMLSG
jgi:hypothetical protein